MTRRPCLQCGKKKNGGSIRNPFFCTLKCTEKWALQQAEDTYDWCDRHFGWHKVGWCAYCEPLDEPLAFEPEEVEKETTIEEKLQEPGRCPKCRDAGEDLVPQLQFFYDEWFDDGLDDAGRIFQQSWYCKKCGGSFYHYDINEDLATDNDARMYELWEEAWEKLGVNRITVICAGPKPSYHRVFESKVT